jgi:hypothetical protein
MVIVSLTKNGEHILNLFQNFLILKLTVPYNNSFGGGLLTLADTAPCGVVFSEVPNRRKNNASVGKGVK